MADDDTRPTDETMVRLIHYMQDVERDIEGGKNTPEAFVDGYGFARYHAVQLYIELSGGFPCDCEFGPSAGKVREGRWRCVECETVLAESTEEAVPRDTGGPDDE